MPGTESFLLARRPGRISSFRVAMTSRAPSSFRSARFARSLVRVSREEGVISGKQGAGHRLSLATIYNLFFAITI